MNYYLVQVSLKEDEDKRATKIDVLVYDTGVTEVEKKTAEHMQGTIAEWEILSIKKTKISDVLL